MNELFRLSAREVVRLLRKREISPVDLVQASLERIDATDPVLNAIPTRCAERALSLARRLETVSPPDIEPWRWLGGIPIGIKDLNDVAGVRTTYGSPLFADHVPATSDATVRTLENHGAIVIGKTNTPEFGHGANTFNEVFGETRNPWNTAMTCGGSSGGSAVAVAAGQTWLATGSDLGCSLRTPAAFCSIVGLRPSPGRVARSGVRLAFDNLWVQGPMARNVGDAALMLDAMCGLHPEDPLSIPASHVPFVQSVDEPAAPRRIAYSRDLNGLTPVTDEVAEVCEAAVQQISQIGVAVEEACPDFSDAREIFRVLRANQFVGDLGQIIEKDRERVRKEVIWNYDAGKQMNAGILGDAERRRSQLYLHVVDFLQQYDLLITPAVVVPPFPVDIRAIDNIQGIKLDSYYEWYAIAYAITLTSLPAISLPCGFTRSGLPLGLQIIGKPRGEANLLAAAAIFESVFGISKLLPIDPDHAGAQSEERNR